MATETATLGLRINPQGFSAANDNLVDFTKKAQQAKEAATGLEGKAQNAGAKVTKLGGDAQKGAAGVDQLAKRSTLATSGLHRLAAAAGSLAGTIAAAFSVAAIARAADGWSDMQSRVGAAIKDMEKAPAIMERLVSLANATYSPLDQTVDTFAGNVGALRDLGKSLNETADYTEAMNHALTITATKGERAMAVQLALGKAMDIGKLQAEGLETVLASGGRVAEALASELGTTVSGLRQMATDGKITGAVIANALINSLEKLRKEAGEMPATMADGLTRIQTGFVSLVGMLDQATGASGTVAGALLSVGDALNAAGAWASQNGETIRSVFNMVASAAVGAATVYAASFVPAMVAGTTAIVTQAGAFVLLNGGIWGAAAALLAVSGVLKTLGIGLVIAAVSTLVYKFIEISEKVGGFGRALGFVKDIGIEVFDRIGSAGQGLLHALSGVALSIQYAFVSAFKAIGQAWDTVANGLASGWNIIADSSVGETLGLGKMGISNVGGMIGGVADGLKQQADAAFSSAGRAFSEASAPLGALSALQAELAKTTKETAEETINLDEVVVGAGNSLGGMGQKAGGAKQQVSDFARVMKSLREEAELLAATQGMSELDKAIYGKQQEAGVGSGSAAGKQIDEVMRLIDGYKKLEDQTKKGADAISGLFTSMLDGSKSLRAGIADLLMDIAKVQMQKAVLGLANTALGGAFSWLGGLLTPNANGGVYSSAGLSAHSGTVVSQPTIFPFAKGAGLMGEAGPEAILPLKRGSDGKLGVSAGDGASGGGQAVDVRVTVTIDEAGQTRVREISQSAAAAAVDSFSRNQFTDRLFEVQNNPRRRG